ncbi:MAG: hypothetical protein CMI01_14640 [Oceanospirillaceae bacterium]|nr:hypothetical protein [Oceanospirillaceae bacterium]
MDRRSLYYRQVQLLLEVMPLVARHDCFALKGGTAINLFMRDLPRLSVDIDLVFLPVMEREEALNTIRSHLEALAVEVAIQLPGTQVVRSFQDNADALRLVIVRADVQVKVELSPVLRGTVYDPVVIPVSEAVEEEFGFAEMRVVAFADLFAGKICAALDRQHPRDLFDVKQLLNNEGLTEDLRKALLVYMVSHPRPIAELLRPQFKEIAGVYEGEFKNMAAQNVSLETLEVARGQLVELINRSLTNQERKFLLSFKRRAPDWNLLGLQGINALPAVRWKLHNLCRMKPERHAQACDRLQEILGL